MVDGQHFIGGAWRPALSGATDGIVNPATGEVITAVPSGDGADVDVAVAAAAAAFGSWGKTTPRERSERLLALADAVEQDLPELKRLEMENVGKPASI
ncbi:MAG TPA: aldehyde dehydrogenase family protein, partial [Acidimicrobiales bacterium]|nr:aldehyde dehydrogenase family protein [Acidimicrobiales bacterium]